jgi:tRNA-dihydrouridine synthase B
VPVTLKFRTGWDPAHRNALRIARLAERAGIRMLTLHGRTRACGFSAAAEYDTIAAVKAAVSIPVVANGDIDTPERAQRVLEATRADAVMIGRAAQGRPWIFREIDHFLRTGARLPPPRVSEVRPLLLAHLDEHYAFYGSELGVRTARKHIAWYTRGLRNSALFRARMNQLQTSHEQLEAVRLFFDGLAERCERLEYDDEVALAA